MELLEQVRVAFIGMSNSGKSTLISALIKHICENIINPEYLMNEDNVLKNEKIFRAAKLICPYKDYELMLIDCPGNIEYIEQIKQGLDLSSIIVCLIDANNVKESKEYCKKILSNIPVHTKRIIYIYTHAVQNCDLEFESKLSNIDIPLQALLNKIDDNSQVRVNIEEEAKQLASTILPYFDKKRLLFSGGKDSIVGYDICMKIDDTYDVIWPKSGFEIKELASFIKGNYITKATRNLPSDMNYTNSSLIDIFNKKIEFNNELEEISDLLIINYRVSDDIVASKDHYIKRGNECHRFSPIFYFSEENIWRYIAKYELEIPSLYFKGYRSIEDEPIAVPSMDSFSTIDEIINYVHLHPFEENNPEINKLKRTINNTYY